jgi:ankyrin repeat protein
LVTGADPSIAGTLGRTALHVAAARGQPKIIQALIDAGAQVDVRDEQATPRCSSP